MQTSQNVKCFKEKITDWCSSDEPGETSSSSSPVLLLQTLRGKNTVDLIVGGSVLEMRDLSDPFLYWPVRVVQNVGGRLRLRYAGLTDDQRAQDTWLFYLDVRLRPLGWARENRLALEPPTGESRTTWISSGLICRVNNKCNATFS